MRKLSVFNQVSVDGYFRTLNGDISWAHRAGSGSAESPDGADEEFRNFIEGNASSGGVLVFGRKTYEQMASFWPTPMAAQQLPIVAKQMNALPKVVFSKTLDKAEWNNARLVKSDPVAEITRMKHEPGEPMTIMGSGTIVSQLTQAGLIDEYRSW